MARLLLLALTAMAVDAAFHMPSPYTWRCQERASKYPDQAGKLDKVCIREEKSAGKEVGMTHRACVLICGDYGALWPRPTTGSLGKTLAYTLPHKIQYHWSKIGMHEDVEELVKGAVEVFKENLLKNHPEYEHLREYYSYDQEYDDDEKRQSQPRQNNRKAKHDVPSTKSSHFHSYNEYEKDQHDEPRFFTGHRFFDSDYPDIQNMTVHLEIRDKRTAYLSLNTSVEEYTLNLRLDSNGISVVISGETFFGIRNGLETLSQLIDYDEERDSLQVVAQAVIADKPAYPYRGLIIDTSRNFMTVKALERTLCGMAASKLNTLHWHITDSNSFPMYLNSLPKMSYYGAHEHRQIYYPEDIQHIVRFGRVRGIRVLPELDAPAHVGNGWEWGQEDNLGKLAVCVAQEPWQKYCVQPPCGQLNIANPNIYVVLKKIYREMIKNFGHLDIFHYGGDEVNVNCWNSSTEVHDWMKAKGYARTNQDYYKEWSVFQDKAFTEFTAANEGKPVPGILWTSHLTEKDHTDRYLDRNKYIIQIWSKQDDPLIEELLRKQYRVIFTNWDSNYLDCGFGHWIKDGVNWCSPFKEWQKFYNAGPRRIANAAMSKAKTRPEDVTTSRQSQVYQREQLLGGEAAMWSEQVDDNNLDSRVWPRTAALAERLWTDPDSDWRAAEIRFINHRQRLAKRGVRADRVQPQWCHQNQGLCYLNPQL